jgi:probable F420-dependent oxidoreductase
MNITIGLHILPQGGDMKRMRERWMEAEALGVDRIYTADHFHSQVFTSDAAVDQKHTATSTGKNFEATSIQAAMAATTTRAEIGCLVHANSYRNPNLLADIARTIDHISGGRFILGIGSGYLQADYDEYGYAYGTAKSRVLDLARDVPIIKARLDKLNPKPLRKIPIMIASMGGEIGMRTVAEHATIWHVYGTLEKIQQKSALLSRLCSEIGRDPAEIEHATFYIPHLIPDPRDSDPDSMVKLGMRHIIATSFGPDWDLGAVRELLAWRRNLLR